MTGEPPAFFLETPMGATPPRIASEELSHAMRVRRLGPGDRVTGVDGCGGRWALEILQKGPGGVLLEALEEPQRLPSPGTQGAPLPWIEVAVAWPKKNRVEGMIGRLVQLGVAAITPLEARHRGPEPVPKRVSGRWKRTAREAFKQSRGAWLPVLGIGMSVEKLCEERRGGALAILDPRGGMSLDTWLRSVRTSCEGLGRRERPIVLVIGPEGGFDAQEMALLLESGATTCSLGPQVLRVETAAEAAAAVAACVLELRTER